jgi:LAO/AO transport system kinase
MNLQRRGIPDPDELAASVAAQDRAAVAAALNLLDDTRTEARQAAARLLAGLPDDRLDEGAHLVGVTGPPGVGKSSLTSALINVWRRQGKRIGILAVDPSSPLSGGALLGDRLRMLAGEGIADHSVFVRSLANRGEYGGLSAEVWPMSLVMLAAFDIVLIETVGVGQREVDVSKLSDTTVFVAQPASGDSIQFLKAGIMEVPHLLVVNKADIGAAARRTLSELRTTLGARTDEDGWEIPVMSVSAAAGTAIPELAETIDNHRAFLLGRGRLAERRRRFQAEWIVKRLRDDFGRFGLAQLGGEAGLHQELTQRSGSPFDQYEALRGRFLANWTPNNQTREHA